MRTSMSVVHVFVHVSTYRGCTGTAAQCFNGFVVHLPLKLQVTQSQQPSPPHKSQACVCRWACAYLCDCGKYNFV